jgi:hypothetical protein
MAILKITGCYKNYSKLLQSTSVITDPKASPKISVIAEVRCIRGSVKLRLK